MEPQYASNMTHQQKDSALQYLMFLKEKWNGTIKEQGCANGRKQWVYVSKEEASTPTVGTESLLLSCLIGAMEGKDIATVASTFMQLDLEGPDTLMKLEGRTVDTYYNWSKPV